ncbi:major facilitator superfamily domain-containing protein [Tricladium varicosporioides]|nr:major facilitator superfamily domain-containing protein [Hymenoscyphus varicosporioides]
MVEQSSIPIQPQEKPPNEVVEATSQPLHSIFTKNEKALLVAFASAGAFFSPLTANIYYPAIVNLSHDLHASTNLINLSITVYLIFQGLAPTFVGSFSDVRGRRPAYIACFVVYFAANLGLALQKSYAALMVLRCLQSSGSSGTVALANALVSDIVTSAERGKYVGYASLGAFLGPILGPIIGGLLNQFLGWRAIFWFLVIFSAVILTLFLTILPETCRNIVGDGSIPPQKWNISLLAHLKQRSLQKSGIQVPIKPPLMRKRPNFLATIQIIFSKNAFLVLLYTGLLFAGFYTITATIPSDFQRVFHFNSLQVGLCYIPFGAGSMVSAIVNGRVIDWNFRRHANKHGITITKGRQTNLAHFPIERARLELVIPLMFTGSLLLIAYGWVLAKTTSLAGPLILMLPMAFCISGSFSVLSTLMVDMYPESPGTATAASNLVRCSMGAGAVAGIGPLVEAWGTGWTCVLVSGIWLGCTPMLIAIFKWGPGWREERRLRIEAKEEKRRKAEVNDPETVGVVVVEGEKPGGK